MYLFILPAKELPSISWLKIPFLDKYIHVVIFFTLSITATSVRNRFNKGKITYPVVLIISLLLISYGIGVEFYQENYVEGRSFELTDILADTAGCLLFLFLFYIRDIAKKSWSR